MCLRQHGQIGPDVGHATHSSGLGAGLQHHFFASLSRGADLEAQCQWQAGATPSNSQQLLLETYGDVTC